MRVVLARGADIGTEWMIPIRSLPFFRNGEILEIPLKNSRLFQLDRRSVWSDVTHCVKFFCHRNLFSIFAEIEKFHLIKTGEGVFPKPAGSFAGDVCDFFSIGVQDDPPQSDDVLRQIGGKCDRTGHIKPVQRFFRADSVKPVDFRLFKRCLPRFRQIGKTIPEIGCVDYNLNFFRIDRIKQGKNGLSPVNRFVQQLLHRIMKWRSGQKSSDGFSAAVEPLKSDMMLDRTGGNNPHPDPHRRPSVRDFVQWGPPLPLSGRRQRKGLPVKQDRGK